MGYVYILTNRSMPGLVKIGKTSRSVVERVRELNLATGVPTPFTVYGYVATEHEDEVESIAHVYLASYRINDGREFFRIDAQEAFQHVSSIAQSKRTRQARQDASAAQPAPGGRMFLFFAILMTMGLIWFWLSHLDGAVAFGAVIGTLAVMGFKLRRYLI